MTVAPVQIDYAQDAEESPPDRLLRKIVGSAALVFGGSGVLQLAIPLALARGWVSRPPNMAWELSPGWGTILFAGELLGECAFLLAGALLLRRSSLGVAVLRWAAPISV